MNLFKPAPDI